MGDIAIRVSGLSKQYHIGAHRKASNTLRDTITDAVASVTRSLRGNGARQGDETIWALKDVSFEVKRGEVLGIIGRNGAGKSTLLKILSRITEPTCGEVDVYGRVASLLEVGTGFHPELTGRENIYLNGAILGMHRREIQRKFDEIVDFSGVEKFIDTPVKHYSSGMYMRLAFAVAAHLEPEILLVDEVLAVGDAEFQKKCLGKMAEVASQGRTVFFVSHNMVAMQQLCQRGMALHMGKLAYSGEIESTIRAYMRSSMADISATELASRTDRKGSQWLKFTRVAIYDSAGNEIPRIMSGQDVKLRFYYVSQKEKSAASAIIATNLTTERGYLLANLNSMDTGNGNLDIYRTGYFECNWPKFCFRAGVYTCDLFSSINGDIVDWVQSAYAITVEDGDYYGTGKIVDRQQGDVLVQHSWSSMRSDIVGEP